MSNPDDRDRDRDVERNLIGIIKDSGGQPLKVPMRSEAMARMNQPPISDARSGTVRIFAMDGGEIGEIIATFKDSGVGVAAALFMLRECRILISSWLQYRSNRKFRISIGMTAIEVEGMSEKDVENVMQKVEKLKKEHPDED